MAFLKRDEVMEKGTVKWFDGSKGYGFILRDSGGEIFVHYSQLKGVNALLERERVEFEVEEDSPKGKQAKDVRIIQTSSIIF